MKKMNFLVFSFAMIRAVEMMTGCGDDDEEVENRPYLSITNANGKVFDLKWTTGSYGSKPF